MFRVLAVLLAAVGAVASGLIGLVHGALVWLVPWSG